MHTRKIVAMITGIAALVVIAFAIYKIKAGQEVGFDEVITIGSLFITFFPL